LDLLQLSQPSKQQFTTCLRAHLQAIACICPTTCWQSRTAEGTKVTKPKPYDTLLVTPAMCYILLRKELQKS
jgi:hypothetical protein